MVSNQQQEPKEEDEWQAILPGVWCVPELLTRTECQELVELAQKEGIREKTPSGDLRHRNRVRVDVHLPTLTQKVWTERILPHIPAEIVVTKEDTMGNHAFVTDPQDCIGRWTPSHMQSALGIHYCDGKSKGHLAAHRDGIVVENEHERSFLTINGYLTDRPVGFGGATRFLKDEILVQQNGDPFAISEDDVLYRVEADRAGKSVVFFQNLMHDGEPLKEGSADKWVFRNFVFYKRDPDTAPQLTEEERRARDLVKEAERCEVEGQITQAIKLYNQAYRLDPSLGK